jgi:hypothetical protein
MLLFIVKVLHSYAIIHLMVCLYVLWDYALAGRHERWIGFAVICILLEALVFVISGFTCPFTTWAIALGDSYGTDYLSEVLYLDRINYVETYTVMAALGLPLAGWRYWKSVMWRRRETEGEHAV